MRWEHFSKRVRLPGVIQWSLMAILVAVLARAPLVSTAQQIEGIYTAEQAQQGRGIYAAQCASCHGSNLMGATASPLVGPRFVTRWGGQPPAAEGLDWTGFAVDKLLANIQKNMPPGNDKSLRPEEYVAVLSHILEQNGFPTGRTALQPDSSLLLKADLGFRPFITEVQPEAEAELEPRLLVWVDRQGHIEPLPAPPRHYYLPRLSPDGRRIAVEVHLEKPDIWIYDLSSGDFRQLTHEGSNRFPLWSPDGARVVFSSDRHQEGPEEQHAFFADHEIYWMAADGSGEAERLTYGEHKYGPQKWTPDGKTLSIYEIHPETYRDIWMLPMEGDRKPWPFLRTPNLEGGIGFSADGRWLAHTSNETGQYEIVIRGYPSAEPKLQVSAAGGVELVWPLGSKELFYRNGNARMAVEITTSPTLKVGTPRVLFEGDFVESPGSRANWDSLDGQRFIIVRKAE